MDFDRKHAIDALAEFYREIYRVWHIMSSGEEIQKENLCDQQVIDRCKLRTNESGYILGNESVNGFRFRQSNEKLLLASQQLILIWDSRACYVSYDDVSSQRFQDFINAAEAWVSDGIPSDNSLLITAALHLIYQDLHDQVQNLKTEMEKRCKVRALRDLDKKGSLLSSKCKKVMDDIFNPCIQVGGVQVVDYLGPNELQECKKLWDSINVHLDDIRASLNTKLRRLKTVLFWSWVLFNVCCLGANGITLVRLVIGETRSSFTAIFGVFAVFMCLFFVITIVF